MPTLKKQAQQPGTRIDERGGSCQAISKDSANVIIEKGRPALRLSNANLGLLPQSVRRPAYERAAVTPGLVHLGIGAFHRAHQAIAIDDILASGALDWGVIGASLRRPDMRQALAPQDYLYTVAVRSGAGVTHRVVGSLVDVIVAAEDTARLLAALTHPATRIVSLTITEKGYCHTPQTGELDETHPDILHDLSNPDAPRSAPGLIIAALLRRKATGIAPFTVLSCDNLPANGATTQRILTRLAYLTSPEFGAWVAGEVACPSTMVDRIVPATTSADRAEIASALGMDDAWPVVTEPFTQWVIEDRFPTGRPDFAIAGGQIVADVAPFERMKLRLLNAAHSGLAYLGYLAGYETVAAAVADPQLRAFACRLMEESAVTLVIPAGYDVAAYIQSLLARFSNPALHHRTWQIAMDGSQKLPQRLLETVRDRLALGLPISTHALAIAGWMRYVTARDEQGGVIDVRDPLASEFAAIAKAAGPVAERLAPALLHVASVFGDLGADPRLHAVLIPLLASLYHKGAHQTVTTALAT